MMESGLQSGLGILCALLASVLPNNAAGTAGFIFFLIAPGMTLIGMFRGKGRRQLVADA
jgi:hypothetical protein